MTERPHCFLFDSIVFCQQGHSTFEETRMRRKMLAEKFHPLDKNNPNLYNPNLA